MPMPVPKSKRARRLLAFGLLAILGLLYAYYTGDQAASVGTSVFFTIDTRDADSEVRALALTTTKDSGTFIIDTRDPDSVARALALGTSKDSSYFTIDTRDPDAVAYALSAVAAEWSGYFTIDTRAESSTRADSAFFTIDTRDPDSVTRALSLASAEESGYFIINTLEPPPTDTDNNGLNDIWEQIHFGGLFLQTRTDDFDGDGLSNFEEFAFGTDPTLFNGPALVQFTLTPNGAGARLTVRHTKHILAMAMVNYAYETSTSLTSWTDTTANWRETADPQNLNGYVEWITMSYDLPSYPVRIFVRVKATPK